jgi:hypothetical protein
MAVPSSFVNTCRARTTAYLKVMEDMLALQTEFVALGGQTFTNTFHFAGEDTGGGVFSTYDLTQTEFNDALTALGEVINAFRGTVQVNTSATRTGALYKLKA